MDFSNILAFLLPPVMGGLIALSTNWLAIRMLFRPHREKRLFGVRLPFTPGLIPKERARLAKKLAEAVSTRLLTPELLAEELADPSLWPLPDMTVGEALQALGLGEAPVEAKLKELADGLLPKAAAALKSLAETHPALDAKLAELTYRVIDENMSRLAGIFVKKEKIYSSIKEGLAELLEPEKARGAIEALLADETVRAAVTGRVLAFHIRDGLAGFFRKEKHAVKRVLGVFAGYLAAHMPVHAMIENRIAAFDVAEAEEIILSVVGRELRVIVMLGGILGFIIGLLAVIV